MHSVEFSFRCLSIEAAEYSLRVEYVIGTGVEANSGLHWDCEDLMRYHCPLTILQKGASCFPNKFISTAFVEYNKINTNIVSLSLVQLHSYD